jgi:hypothetical protein
MKNFIIFVIVASCLAFAGYFGYRVYYLGELPQAVWQSMTGSGGEKGARHVELADAAWEEQRWADAAKHYEAAKAAHLAGDPVNKLEIDEDIEHVYVRIGGSWLKAYEASGGADETARRRAVEAFRIYLDDERWKDSPSRRGASRDLSKLQ